MHADRARLVRQAAASAADALRIQAAAGARGFSGPEAAAALAALARLEALVEGAANAPARPLDRPAERGAEVPPNSPPRAAQASGTTESHTTASTATLTEAPAGAPRAQRPAERTVERVAPSGPVSWGAPRLDVHALKGSGVSGLAAIRAELGDCRRCGLCDGRTNLVFGFGDPSARLMFIGEGPGADEDAKGEPFVGRAGQLLTRMIGAMGLTREQVYIANIIKCRPPNNRDPAPVEITRCLPFLKAQIAAVNPEVVVTLGRIATSALSQGASSIRAARGRWLALEDGTPVMPTYHPSYLLRLNDDELKAARRETWSDLQLVMQKLDLPLPPQRGPQGA